MGESDGSAEHSDNDGQCRTFLSAVSEGTGSRNHICCIQGVPMGKQQELAEVSYQLRPRMLELNARSFAAIPIELVPIEASFISTLFQQEVPDYFAGQQWQKTPSLKTPRWFSVQNRKNGRPQS